MFKRASIYFAILLALFLLDGLIGSDLEIQAQSQSDLIGTPYEVAWQQNYGWRSDDNFYDITPASDGGYLLAGRTTSKSKGDYQGWLVKVDEGGNMQWQQSYGGGASDKFIAILPAPDGGYLIAGSINTEGKSFINGWLVKVDRRGKMQWQQNFGGESYEEFRGIAIASDGGYILSGITSSQGAGSYDGWLVKVDESGNMQWEQVYGGKEIDVFHAMTTTSDGGYQMVGWTESIGAGYMAGWLVKVDSRGKMQWQRAFGGERWDQIMAITQATDDGYLLAGLSEPQGERLSQSWLIKVDDGGNTQWQKTYDGIERNSLDVLMPTSDGGYILAGAIGDYGEKDGRLIKVDSRGNLQWQRNYGGEEDNAFRALALTFDGGYLLVGNRAEDGWLVLVKPSSNK